MPVSAVTTQQVDNSSVVGITGSVSVVNREGKTSEDNDGICSILCGNE